MTGNYSVSSQRQLEAQADLSLLELLVKVGPYEFPLARDRAEEQALQHAEALRAKGLLRRLEPNEARGPSYEVTDSGRTAYRSFKEARR